MGLETKASTQYQVLFVCSGNICRSPLAETLFKSMAQNEGILASFVVDSAGTHALHEGDQADPRTRRVAQKHGLIVDSIARPVADDDFDRFDLIIAMDQGHRRELISRGGSGRTATIRMMREFDPVAKEEDVADPYYGGEAGFDKMYVVLESACRGLLEAIRP
jgi:protein-tyrosine phosphatase